MKNLKKKVVVAICVVAFTMAGVFGVINTANADNPDEPTATRYYSQFLGNCFVLGNTCVEAVVVTPEK